MSSNTLIWIGIVLLPWGMGFTWYYLAHWRKLVAGQTPADMENYQAGLEEHRRQKRAMAAVDEETALDDATRFCDDAIAARDATLAAPTAAAAAKAASDAAMAAEFTSSAATAASSARRVLKVEESQPAFEDFVARATAAAQEARAHAEAMQKAQEADRTSNG